MIRVIIFVFLIVLVVAIFRAIIEFVQEHKKFSIIALVVVICIIYRIMAEEPSGFFDSIWVYGLILSACHYLSKLVVQRISKTKKSMLVCTVLASVSLLVCTFSYDGTLSRIAVFEVILGIVGLYAFGVIANRNIGQVKDVNETYIRMQKPIVQTLLIHLMGALGVISVVNICLGTFVSISIIPTIICPVLLAIEIKWFAYGLRGYYFINKYVKEHEFFSNKDLFDTPNITYLSDAYGYSQSVLRIMSLKKKIYEFSVLPGWYFNRTLELKFEKYIKANLSSEEIASRLKIDFRELEFEKVYKFIFAKVKGYEIDFTESDVKRLEKKSEVGVGATEFILMRYPIAKHPLLNESVEIRKSYIIALNYLVCCGDIDKDKWSAKVEEYQEVFGVDDITGDSKSALDVFSKAIIRKVNATQIVKSDYSYILLLEAIYFENLLTEEAISYQKIERTFEVLKISKTYRDFIYCYIKAMYIEGNAEKAKTLLDANIRNKIRKDLEYVHFNIMWNERYVALKQFSVAVCATMSAGKSTFINSILGVDYIPAKNEACTAKITTIRDNDNLDKLIGCYTRVNGSKVYSNVINRDVLNRWNEDVDVSETILEGNIEDVGCGDGILVIHDTPGTNNSEDISHHDKTITFINDNDMNIIIYLINAEYISTNDTEILLKEIQEIVKNKDTQIVFGLNKIDAYDEEGNENIEEAIQGLVKQLQMYGFEKPIIFPFSANAARLFKLVLKGKELTKREKRIFDNLFEYFSRFNSSNYVVNAQGESSSINYPKLKKDRKILIDEVGYSYNEIVEALENTGIICIENWLATLMKDIL